MATARFGPYEVDARSGEVRKFGVRVRLGEQPLQILILLMGRPGELVTREELRAKLWSDDTFVDFDHGLNSAVQRLRDSLSDTAEKAQWIETVPRRGYRFVGEVQWTQPNGGAPERAPASDEVSPAPATSAPVPAIPHSGALDIPKSGFWSWPAIAGAVFTVTIVCVATYLSLASIHQRDQPQNTNAGEHVVLAVLPFQNLSGDPSQDFFTDGLTEEMIMQLGALNPDQLAVIARTTSMAYKHTSKSVKQIGTELGVDYVLESSVRRDGDQLRITVQLIRTRDQLHVWAQSYDRQISGSIALQEEVARAVAARIEVRLSPDYASRPARSHPDPAANEAYLRGRFFGNQFTPDGYRKAVANFQEAIARDPSFAEAYSGLADSYRFLVVTDTMPPSEASPKIADSARQAVALDDGLAESHNSMGNAMMDRWDWAGADKECKRAIALNPSYSNAHRVYAAQLAGQLRHQEASEQINEAMRTDPLSLPNNAEVVRTLYYAREYDGALTQAQKALQLDRDYYRTHFWMARVYAQKHMYKEAIAEAEIVQRAVPGSNMALTELAYSLAVGDRKGEARRILRTLEVRAQSSFIPAYNLAVIHIGLHENAAALKYLQQSYEDHDWALMVLACEPRLDPLRSSPQFRDLVAKVGLPQ